MTDSTTDPADASNPSDAAKDRFREALERKRGKRHPHESASQNDSKVHDAHSAAGGKRTFRRKSG
jgi:hypothetical protein